MRAYWNVLRMDCDPSTDQVTLTRVCGYLPTKDDPLQWIEQNADDLAEYIVVQHFEDRRS